MTTISLSPDELVEHLIEEIIVTYFSSAKLSQIWKIVCDRLEKEAISDAYKSIIWSWIVKKPEIEVYNGKSLVPFDHSSDLGKLLEEVREEQNIDVRIEEGKQWLYLTNKPKEGNPVGMFPFNLLKYIISRKERGISGAELARVSGQDPRSLTSRLGILEKEGLIKKSTANIPGITTSLVVHTKFYISFKESLPIFDRHLLMKQVVEVIKNSKNSLRTQRDVAEELGYAGSSKALKRFRRVTRNLCSKGNLKWVLVAPHENSVKRATTRALMYVKDFQLERESEEDDDIDDDIDEDDDEDDDDDESPSLLASYAPSDELLLQEENIEIVEDKREEFPTLNHHFPVLNQAYEIIRNSGSNGIPAMLIGKGLVGSATSWFMRYLSDLKLHISPASDHLSNYGIVRAPDSEGKMKFYRYFSQEEFSKITGEPLCEAAGKFPELVITDDPSLLHLSLKCTKALSNCAIEFVHCSDGVDRLHWAGITDPSIRAQHSKQLKNMNNILTSTSFVDDSTNETVASMKAKITAAQAKSLLLTGSGSTAVVERRGRPKKNKDHAASKRPLSAKEELSPSKKQKLEDAETSPNNVPSKIVSRPSTDPVFTISTTRKESLNLSGIFETIPRHSIPLIVPKVEEIDEKMPIQTRPLAQFNIDFGSFRGSIQSNRRRRALLEVMKEHGGLVVVESLLARSISAKMNLTTLVDKVTMKKDTSILVENGLVTTMNFQEKLKGGEVGGSKTLLIAVENRPTEEEILEFIDCYNANVSTHRTLPVAEVVSVPMEFKRVNTPKAFLPRPSALDRKLAERKVKPSDAFLTSKKSKPEKKKANEGEKKSHKKRVSQSKSPGIIKEEIDPMLSYLSNIKDLKRKVKSKKRELKKNDGTQLPREKVKESYDFDYIISVLKAYTIVTSLLFNKTTVDWQGIADAVDEEDENPERIKRRWLKIRRGLKHVTLPKIKEIWEKFLNVSVKKGTITYKMLISRDYRKMFELWNESDMGKLDGDIILYSNYEDNLIDNVFKPLAEEKIAFAALPSSLEKARYLTAIPFTSPVEPIELKERPFDKQQAVLKSIFAIPLHDFNPKRSRDILKSLGNYFPALKDLEVSKEIAYLGENSETKFTLPEKTWALFQNKIDTQFLEGSSKFVRGLKEVFGAGKGMILSAVTPDYTIACILHLLVEKKLKVILIDRVIPRKYDGYFTRGFDMQMLESDFVLTLGDHEISLITEESRVPVPMGEPCSRVWIDMYGNLNGDTWKMIVAAVINHVYFRPGIDIKGLYDLTRSLLLLFELKEVVLWLQEKHAIKKSDDGYIIQGDKFMLVIG